MIRVSTNSVDFAKRAFADFMADVKTGNCGSRQHETTDELLLKLIRKAKFMAKWENLQMSPYVKMDKDYYVAAIDHIMSIELDTTKEEAYQHEYDLIQQYHATESYNISEGGLINPVYCPQVVEKLKKTHQEKYPDILQYKFENNNFALVNRYNGLRDAARTKEHDFRAIQKSIKNTQAHHNFYWVEAGKETEWLDKFLARHTCCVAKINEDTGEIEDTALTIREFAQKYNTTYSRIYASIIQNNRCEKKYKFIRITAKQFAEINNLSL